MFPPFFWGIPKYSTREIQSFDPGNLKFTTEIIYSQSKCLLLQKRLYITGYVQSEEMILPEELSAISDVPDEPEQLDMIRERTPPEA